MSVVEELSAPRGRRGFGRSAHAGWWWGGWVRKDEGRSGIADSRKDRLGISNLLLGDPNMGTLLSMAGQEGGQTNTRNKLNI